MVTPWNMLTLAKVRDDVRIFNRHKSIRNDANINFIPHTDIERLCRQYSSFNRLHIDYIAAIKTELDTLIEIVQTFVEARRTNGDRTNFGFAAIKVLRKAKGMPASWSWNQQLLPMIHPSLPRNDAEPVQPQRDLELMSDSSEGDDDEEMGND